MAAPSLLRGRLVDSITFALLAGAVVLGSQTGAQFQSGVNAVEVYATVTDQNGELVTGLTQADFEVLENGEPQAISTFVEADFPLAVAIALDRSFSMAGTPLALSKSAARTFLGSLGAEDEAAVLAVGSEVELVSPLGTDRTAQYAALSALDTFGTTGLHDAVIRAIDLTQGGKGRRALVILSDGNDRYSRATADEALQKARASDVLVYPVAVGRTRPALFAELASLTGGRSFHAREPKALNEILTTVARELKHQYLLAYTPRRPLVAGSGEWRAITVQARRPRVRVRARDGYLVR